LIKFQPDWKKIRERSLYVASPLYANSLLYGYHNSVMQLMYLCSQRGVRMASKCVGCDSLVPRARNRLVAHYLEYDATDFLFVDADITFLPEDALTLLAFDEPIICGIYPRKQIDWHRIAEAARRGVPPEKLPRYGYIPVVNFEGGEFRLDELMPVRRLGTGFLRIRREVFTQMVQRLGDRIQFDYHSDEPHFKGPGYDLFPTGPDVRYPLGSGGRQYLSEDYGFSELAKECGFKLWAAPWIRLIHSGHHDFEGDMSVLDETEMEKDARGAEKAKAVSAAKGEGGKQWLDI
jgi:hypothetical protein